MSRTRLSIMSAESFSSSTAWKSKRLSRVDILVDDAQGMLGNSNELADFQKSWEDEFKESVHHQQKTLVAASSLMALLLSVSDLIIHYADFGLSPGASTGRSEERRVGKECRL